jgi:hypothetical protein
LRPAPVADRRSLIRRATFDLTGLPPTPAEVDAFLADRAPGAWERVIDRLLASPSYGERWGRHWLDVARYADSNGVDENLVYTQAWRYRDYVVGAMNRDLPFDKFIQEQLAGDLLPSTGNELEDVARLAATGYLSLGPKMLAEDDPVKQELDIIDEQIDTLGKTFLGLTLGCARCHDHKFDPLPQTDYYALAGIFKSTKTMMNFKNMAEWQERPLVGKVERERSEEFARKIAAKRDEREKQVKTAGEVVLSAAKQNAAEYFRLAGLAIETEKSGIALKPVLGSGPLPIGGLLIEAEDFKRGNVLKARDGFGKGIGVLVNAGQYPNRVEYELTIPVAAPYQLDLRYASNDPRPVRVLINGKTVKSNAAGGITGGFNPAEQQWEAEGIFQLDAGDNVIVLERESYFPHIDKLLLTPAPDAVLTQSVDAMAASLGLQSEFLSQAISQRKAMPAITAEKLELSLPEKPEGLLPANTQAAIKLLDEEIKRLEANRPVVPKAMAVSDDKPTDLRVHLRGNYLTQGALCERRFPAVLAGERQPAIPPDHSGRLELALWLTRPDNPLTARVIVNRVWRWHFGVGIVPSTDNFGMLGSRPSNEALLDWLATTFVGDCGWSLKKLHRLIMTSNTYKMSTSFDEKAARIDPENTLLWRMNRRRLEAEAIRDSILAVSGQLDRTMGGSLLKFKDREYVTSTANSDPVNYRSTRRSIYLPVIRSALYDVYTAFDFGDPTVMNGDRPSTTVAPQALFMMNSSLVLEQSRAMATDLLKRADDDAARIDEAFVRCFSRPPSKSERQRSIQFVAQVESAFSSDVKAEERRLHAWQSLCKSLMASNEFIFVE